MEHEECHGDCQHDHHVIDDTEKIFRLGMNFYRQKEYETARQMFESIADDFVDARTMLGYIYTEGTGVEVDKDKAFDYFLSAAQEKDPIGEYNLGQLYMDEGNFSSAFDWFKKAADQGHTKAQCNVGRMYLDGNGVEQDNDLAIQYFHKAADGGDAEVQHSLGCMYFIGQGVEMDKDKAFQLFCSAAKQNHRQSINRLVKAASCGFQPALDFFQNNEITMKEMKTDEKFILGAMYLNGDQVDQCYEKAFLWFTEAAKEGHPEAQNNLAVMYTRGLHVEQDFNMAAKWFFRATKLGNKRAKENLEELLDFCPELDKRRYSLVRLYQCETCQQDLPKSKFSKTQIKNKRNRRCKDCITS